jgi:hypothetical protein
VQNLGGETGLKRSGCAIRDAGPEAAIPPLLPPVFYQLIQDQRRFPGKEVGGKDDQ